MRAKAAKQQVALLRSIRSRAEKRLLALPHVIGTMLGAKETGGELTGELGLTVLVSTKCPATELDRQQRIPSSLKLEGKAILLDVVECPPLLPQSGSAFPSGTITTFDGTEYGTMTAFARGQHAVYGLTCAHAIEGLDNNPYTQSPIAIWSPSLNRTIPVGMSAMALAGGGAGVPGAFGFSDAALFTLTDRTLYQRAFKATPIPLALPRFGETVYGSATSGDKVGTVIGIEKRVGNHLADVVIRVAQPGTFRGDSGMLWRNASGHALAIHAQGDGAPGIGSRLTAAMNATRAASGLSVTLLEH